MTWDSDNPMLDIEGKPTDRHEHYGTDCHYVDQQWALEDTIGRLLVRVTALERLWDRVADIEAQLSESTLHDGLATIYRKLCDGDREARK